ncbi:hypothetical protein [Kitasatospora kifunensis]|uniref:Uncharacterized protein n=1 Tax=Kitasatospora kifunensis TaxID=58351 RepID=A0A7W7RAB0_KITKI|nr:hypothetical protein [Kitasatospora kifunensis]MBB4928296.1 hypothetical protein [Kitasatospora kifunensis]
MKRRDIDAWGHILGYGTHTAITMLYPRSPLLQGAEPYLRHTAHRRGVNPDVAAKLQDVLREWDTDRCGTAATGRHKISALA